MKINYDCPTEQIQVSHSILLKPGENDLPDEIAQDLIAGSDALVASIANTKKKREWEAKPEDKRGELQPATDAEIEAARKSMKGKGLSTAVASPAASVSSPTRKKGGEG